MGTIYYNWDLPTPDDYVKDTAGYIGALGSDADQTVYELVGLTPVGLTLLTSQSFTSVTSVTVDNVFTSVYTNYEIIINLTSASQATNGTLRLRANGSTNSTANYNYSHVYQATGNATVSSQSGLSVTAFQDVVRVNSGSAGSYARISLGSPYASNYTKIQQLMTDSAVWRMYGGYFASTASFDGFVYAADSGNVTGNLQIYGYRI